MSDERITVRLQLKDSAKFIAEAKAAGHEIEALGDKTDRAGKKAKPFSSELDRINKITKAMRWPVAIAGLGLFGQMLSAGATGGVAFVAALAPLVGLLGTLPALGVLAGQGMGVLALATSGVKDAMGGLNGEIDAKKFAALPRPAQDFALSLDSLKPRIRSLQSDVQAGLFPGLTKGLRSAAPALDALHGPLVGTAGVFGTMGANLGALVGSRGFLSDLASQARFNNVQFGRLGGAGLHVVNMFRNLMVTARPLVAWMVKLVAGWAAAGDHAITLGRASGGLVRMFHSVQVTASRVGRIIGDLAVAFFNVGKIGKRALGDELLVGLVHGSDALRKWTESGPGVQKITKFFVDAKPVIYATGKLLGDVATQLLRFGAGSDGGLVHILMTLDSMVATIGWLSRLVGPDTVVYAFLAMKGIGAAFKLFQIASGLQAIVAASTLLGGVQATSGVTAATAAGATAGHAYAVALRSAALAGTVGIGVVIASQINKGFTDALETIGIKRPRKNGPTANGFSTVPGQGSQDLFGTVKHLVGGLLGGKAMGGPVWQTGPYLVGERGPEIVNLQRGAYVTPNHELGRGPRSSPVSRATSVAGGGASTLERMHITVMPQPIFIDGLQVAEVTADVAVKHEARR